MRRVIVLIGIAVCLGVLTPSANACTCAPSSSPCASYGSAAAVFVGTVKGELNNQENGWTRTFKFAVEQSYLGVDGTEVEVSTGRGGGDCGYRFKVGERYLVYAYRNDNRLRTSICSRTRPFAQATEDLAFLENLSSAAPGATIYGRVVHKSASKNSSPFDEDVFVRIEGQNVRRDVFPDAQGRYRLAGLPPGTFKVALKLPETLAVAQPERYVTIFDRSCALVDFFIIDNGRLSGRVVDAKGQPVSNIMVSVVDPASVPGEKFIALNRTDDEGRFNFSVIPAGRYLIAVNFNRFPEPNDPTTRYPPRFYPGVADQQSAEVITLAVGEKRTGLEVRVPLPRTASMIKGQVVWADGTPVESAFLNVRDVTLSASSMRRGVEVDQQGRFTINGYVGQKLILQAHSTQQRDAQNQPAEGSVPVRITLQRPTEAVKIVISKLQ